MFSVHQVNYDTCFGQDKAHLGQMPTVSEPDSHKQDIPALLQSTLKLFFWLMKPFVSPRPLATTRLASELPQPGAACWVEDTLRVTGSTNTDEVSCMLWLVTRREPEQENSH